MLNRSIHLRLTRGFTHIIPLQPTWTFTHTIPFQPTRVFTHIIPPFQPTRMFTHIIRPTRILTRQMSMLFHRPAQTPSRSMPHRVLIFFDYYTNFYAEVTPLII